MNRISKLPICNRLSRPLSAKLASPRPLPKPEAVLRDMAYILHLTRSIKESIVASKGF